MKAGNASGWISGPVPVIEPEYLTNILAAASDLTFVLEPDGRIRSILVDDAVEDHSRLRHWAGRPMADFLTSESIPKFEGVLDRMSSSGDSPRNIELNHCDDDDWQHPVSYSFHPIGPEGAILMTGRDLRTVAETQDQLVRAQIALEQGYEEQREYDARYRVLMANTRDAVIFVSANGKIKDCNTAAALLLGIGVKTLIGAPLSKAFKHRRKDELIDLLSGAAKSDLTREVVLQTSQSRKSVMIVPSEFRAGGERLILCRMSEVGSDTLSQDRQAQILRSMFQTTSDAIAICNSGGVIEEVNQAFVETAGINSTQDAKSKSLSDFLLRGQIDLNVMLENTLRNGTMRLYATQMSNDLGSQTAVEVSSVHLDKLDQPVIGFIFRNVDRANVMRGAGASSDQVLAQQQNVADLVGSAKLKDIISESSDVIEKMCIEAAVDLTRNNRAAAAEMLGLSRQSLYVKLRKYGLLKREEG